MPSKKRKKSSTAARLLRSIAAVAALTVIAFFGAKALLSRNCVAQTAVVYLPSGSTFTALIDSLDGKIMRPAAFTAIAKAMGLNENVRGGKYTLREGMSQRAVARMFRDGLQTPVRLTFNNIRSLEQLAGRIGAQIEADSATILATLTSPETLEKYGFSRREILGMFIPDTYEFYWTVAPDGFVERMNTEYEKFWDNQRDSLRKRSGLSRKEVATLASIVCEETRKSDEMPTVASVYINRLKMGMPLQADPTVKAAIGDWSIRRVLKRHLQVDSPYNTYMHRGLPPGPISMPSVKGLDAVLNFKEHNYIYFCASPDFSGYHRFATTLSEHNRNAAEYARALNRAGIR